jgi:hypothetical protein
MRGRHERRLPTLALILKQSDRIVAERSLDGTRWHCLRACRKPIMEWMKIHPRLVDFPSSWSAVAAASRLRARRI